MYGGDPFFMLTPWGRVGLVVVSAMLAGLLLLAVIGLSRGRAWPLRLGIAALSFFAFVWLSPQVYYLYFMALFDGLPWQIVVKPPPAPRDLLSLLAFGQRGTLANHGAALLGWTLGIAALLRS